MTRPRKPRKPIRRTVIKHLKPVKFTTWTIFCSECGKARITTRSDTTTCGDACRSRRYRRVQKEREEMRKMQVTEPLFYSPLRDDGIEFATPSGGLGMFFLNG